MTQDEIKEFSIRVGQSSKTGLVVITYEIIDNYLNSAKAALKADDIDLFKFNIKKAKQFVNDLSSNLDFKYKISFDLMSIYLFINKTLVSVMVNRDEKIIDRIIGMINNLKNAFEKVAIQDDRGQAMPNSQALYAGLTYGPGSKLNEYVARYSKY